MLAPNSKKVRDEPFILSDFISILKWRRANSAALNKQQFEIDHTAFILRGREGYPVFHRTSTPLPHFMRHKKNARRGSLSTFQTAPRFHPKNNPHACTT
jgi:hypothetical protein